MSVLICEGCGELTQTDVCNLQPKEDSIVVTECYARILENNRAWVKGCAYDHCDSFAKFQANKLIKGLAETSSC